ncbi:unnamed protein product [Peniophora sp. CBMAI 1063]|nr:unnamed protein product [Peniophora sp. CBMAI 1063]
MGHTKESRAVANSDNTPFIRNVPVRLNASSLGSGGALGLSHTEGTASPVGAPIDHGQETQDPKLVALTTTLSSLQRTLDSVYEAFSDADDASRRAADEVDRYTKSLESAASGEEILPLLARIVQGSRVRTGVEQDYTPQIVAPPATSRDPTTSTAHSVADLYPSFQPMSRRAPLHLRFNAEPERTMLVTQPLSASRRGFMMHRRVSAQEDGELAEGDPVLASPLSEHIYRFVSIRRPPADLGTQMGGSFPVAMVDS